MIPVPHGVRINVAAQVVLEALHISDSVLAELVEDVLDALETAPALCGHEPYPHERGAAFLTQILGTSWFVVWIYAPSEREVVLVAKIGQIS